MANVAQTLPRRATQTQVYVDSDALDALRSIAGQDSRFSDCGQSTADIVRRAIEIVAGLPRRPPPRRGRPPKRIDDNG